MPLSKYLFFLVFVFGLSQTSYAKYRIEGKINMKGEWQNQVYLTTIDKLDDYYNANADFIINVANIDTDGHFVLEGDNLPDDAQFYRLYLVKEEHSEFNACLFVGGEEHNFIHLLLKNDSRVNISADENTFAPFGDYSMKADKGNQLMRALGRMVYPSYHFYEIKFPTELKFSQDKLNRDLFQFSDTCSNTLVALAAINNTDFDVYFQSHYDNYQSFQNRLNEEYPDHAYTRDYKRKLRYYGDDLDESDATIWKWLTALFAGLSLLLLAQMRRLKKDQSSQVEEVKIEEANFTPQELKILQLISSGHSNKEIANELFIEVSTVKSHINKLYAKLQVKNRQEAKSKARLIKMG